MIPARKRYGEDVVGMELVLKRYGLDPYLVHTISVPSTLICAYPFHTPSIPVWYQHIETPIPQDF